MQKKLNLFDKIKYFLLILWKSFTDFIKQKLQPKLGHQQQRDIVTNLQNVPGPKTLPFIGSSWLYGIFGPYERRQYHLALEHMNKKFGPVVRENVLWNFPLIHLFDRKDILKVLKANTEFPLRPPNVADVYYRRFKGKDYYLNDGMVNLNGPEWHKLRTVLASPIMNRATPAYYMGHMNSIAEEFVSMLGQKREVENFVELVYKVGFEMVGTITLERRLGALEKSNPQTTLILDSIKGYQSSSNEAMYGLPWWKYLPDGCSGVFTNLVRHKDTLFEIIGSLVDETMKTCQEEMEQDTSKDSDTSVLKQLLRKVISGETNIKDVKAVVVDYITAGVDTIGNTVILAIFAIARNKNAQTKLQAELDSILRQGEELTSDSISRMVYLKACVKESFRLYPTASQIARIIGETTPVNGGKIVLPQYSVVLCHQRVASLNEDNFTKAKEFLPERWLADSSADFPAHEPNLVLPFGVGKRICPGKRLAELETYILVAKLFQHFRIELDNDFEMEFDWLLTPKNGRNIRLSQRY